MRFSHWLKTVASALLLSAAAGPVLAQGPGGPGYGQPMFQPAYGTNDPGVLYPQGVPQGYQPYPAISPYGNVGFDQTFRDNDGLWFQRILNTDREFFGSMGVTHNSTRSPGNQHLGSEFIPYDVVSRSLQGFTIPTYGQGGTGAAAGGGNAVAGIPTSLVILDRRVIPYVPTSAGVFTGRLVNDMFPIRDLSALGDFRSGGIDGQWGFFNEDGTGMAVSGFWTGHGQQSFQMGFDSINGIPITQDIITELNGRILFTRNGAIPLDWGFQNLDGVYNGLGNVGMTKYDLLFSYGVSTSTVGTDTNFYMTPIIQREALKVRPLIGGRYMHINEQFRFRGIDSGFDYTVTAQAGGGNNATANTWRPTAGSLVAVYDQYEARLQNNVDTNLAGPQVGLRYDLGDGDEFRLWGQTIVGLMANQESYHLSGNNIGDQMGLIAFSNGLDMLATDARFNNTRTVNHVSPLFEQTFMAEMQILDMIPLVRKLPGIDNTVFRMGYTFTVVGEVARAGESIDWRGFPDFPGIRPGREAWWTSRWSFGVEKRF